MAGDSPGEKLWKRLRVGGRDSAESKTQDGSPLQHGAIASSADLSQDTERATVSTMTAPPTLRSTADASTPPFSSSAACSFRRRIPYLSEQHCRQGCLRKVVPGSEETRSSVQLEIKYIPEGGAAQCSRIVMKNIYSESSGSSSPQPYLSHGLGLSCERLELFAPQNLRASQCQPAMRSTTSPQV
jgi:hypothetical protein